MLRSAAYTMSKRPEAISGRETPMPQGRFHVDPREGGSLRRARPAISTDSPSSSALAATACPSDHILYDDGNARLCVGGAIS